MQNLKLLLAGAFLFVGSAKAVYEKNFVNGHKVTLGECEELLRIARETPSHANAPTSTRPAKPKNKYSK